jgi:hypothetical protein
MSKEKESDKLVKLMYRHNREHYYKYHKEKQEETEEPTASSRPEDNYIVLDKKYEDADGDFSGLFFSTEEEKIKELGDILGEGEKLCGMRSEYVAVAHTAYNIRLADAAYLYQVRGTYLGNKFSQEHEYGYRLDFIFHEESKKFAEEIVAEWETCLGKRCFIVVSFKPSLQILRPYQGIRHLSQEEKGIVEKLAGRLVEIHDTNGDTGAELCRCYENQPIEELADEYFKEEHILPEGVEGQTIASIINAKKRIYEGGESSDEA